MAEPGDHDDEAVRMVRRRLLGRYMAPAVLATLILPEVVHAASCSPSKCTPAQPTCAPTTNCTPFKTCSPSKGG